MRSRFFVITLCVLLIVTTGAMYLYAVFLKRERMAFIDQQVRETATALVDSEFADLRKIDFEQADNIISEELGESRIGKFFVIRNAHDETIFESASASLLPISEIPKDQQWFEISTKGKFIRVLNLKLPRFPDRTLQVGLVLDETLMSPSYFSKTSLMFVSSVLVLGLLASLFLTSFLLRPIAKLDRFLSEVTTASRKKNILPAVPESILKNPNPKSRDEFERVVAGLNALIEKVNKNYEFSRLWAYQMAHELKTPLSLANMEIERLQKRLQLSPQEVEDLTYENIKMSETINSFLGWAELENSSGQKRLFMIAIAGFVEELVERFQREKDRIEITVLSDFTIPANPQHLEQLIQNLVQNALNHTEPESKITVQISSGLIVVEDRGSGIPPEVLERIGEPFNRGGSTQVQKKGHGLGLAWVMSVCHHYGWNITFTSLSPGTRVSVQFSNLIDTQRSEIT